MLEEREGHVLDGCRHGVFCVYRAKDHGPFLGAPILSNAYAFKVRNHGKILPHLFSKPILRKLLTENGVGFSHCLQAIPRDGAKAADAQTGAGKRLTVNHAVGKSKGFAHHSDFILKEKLQRLHQGKPQILRQAAHVVMRFHGATLKNIRVNGALRQKFNALLLAGFLLKNADKLRADDLALLLRFRHAGQLVQKAIHRIDINQIGVHLVFEHPYHLLRLSLAQQAVVDMDAHQLFADGPDQQRRYYGGVHAPGQGQKHLLFPYLLPDRSNLFRNKPFRQSGRGDPFHVFRTFVLFHIDTFHMMLFPIDQAGALKIFLAVIEIILGKAHGIHLMRRERLRQRRPNVLKRGVIIINVAVEHAAFPHIRLLGALRTGDHTLQINALQRNKIALFAELRKDKGAGRFCIEYGFPLLHVRFLLHVLFRHLSSSVSSSTPFTNTSSADAMLRLSVRSTPAFCSRRIG